MTLLHLLSLNFRSYYTLIKSNEKSNGSRVIEKSKNSINFDTPSLHGRENDTFD